MATIEDQITSLEEEIFKTQKNKATEHHIGKLKAKIAKLKAQVELNKMRGGGGGKRYFVKKSGDATVALVGFPSVGKSSLLNILTDARSEVAAYQFTTLEVIPGIMEYRGAKIQILDMPGIIKGASKGKGRGREVITAARAADIIVLLGMYSTTAWTSWSESSNMRRYGLTGILPMCAFPRTTRGAYS